MLLMGTLAGVASADKVHQFIGDGLGDTREGGEDWGTALVITNLPYSDTGATCDNNHTVDLSCGYTAGISPDVFYSYTACLDGTINISLCGSGYDTELAIFDANHNELFCNDDFCSLQSEIDGIPVVSGQLYYICVSGYYGSCGSYIMNITGPTCPVPVQQMTWGQTKNEYR
jgi:hypothetical protein